MQVVTLQLPVRIARIVAKCTRLFNAGCYSSGMVEELAHLLKIREDLLVKARVLEAVAADEAELSIALECLRLAYQCKHLYGEIEVFTNGVLENQAPQGTC